MISAARDTRVRCLERDWVYMSTSRVSVFKLGQVFRADSVATCGSQLYDSKTPLTPQINSDDRPEVG